MATPTATVAIVNYNGAHLLPSCLDALHAQKAGAPSFDTVVVDNASVDESRELLAVKYPWVRVIASDTNTGFAGGNNLALRGVRTPFAVLLNNDATPEPGWLAHLLAPFAEEGGDGLAVVSGKIVFMPRFVRLSFACEGFQPGPHDTRDLGVRIYRVAIDSIDVTAKVLWESAAYGPEGTGEAQFRWTRPSGQVLVPVPRGYGDAGLLGESLHITVSVAAEKTTALCLDEITATVGPDRGNVEVEFGAGTPVLDVVNNAGGVVFSDGSGADRGFQQVDSGQFDESVEVFNACGNGMAIRTEVGEQVGWFDDDFFMYYEDADLSWRIRSCGWAIRYQPDAVLRHIHAASSTEWSPRWIFHVERNRLLMLTKDASTGLALRAVLRYPLTTLSMALRAAVEAARVRRRPAVGPHVLRVRIFASYLRLLPRMLVRRARIARQATVSRPDLEKWLVGRP
jgi:GT2 family glycosyltransferase